MRTVRTIAAVVILACAVIAAYYSYSVAFAPPPMTSAIGGPPAGFSMPKMGGPAAPSRAKDAQKTSEPKKSQAGAKQSAILEKGGDH